MLKKKKVAFFLIRLFIKKTTKEEIKTMADVITLIRAIVNEFSRSATEQKIPDPMLFSNQLVGCSFCESKANLRDNAKSQINGHESAYEWEFCPSCESRVKKMRELCEQTNLQLVQLPLAVAVERSSGVLELGTWTCSSIFIGPTMRDIKIIVLNKKDQMKHLTIKELEDAAIRAAVLFLKEKKAKALSPQPISDKKRKYPSADDTLTLSQTDADTKPQD